MKNKERIRQFLNSMNSKNRVISDYILSLNPQENFDYEGAI